MFILEEIFIASAVAIAVGWIFHGRTEAFMTRLKNLARNSMENPYQWSINNMDQITKITTSISHVFLTAPFILLGGYFGNWLGIIFAAFYIAASRLFFFETFYGYFIVRKFTYIGTGGKIVPYLVNLLTPLGFHLVKFALWVASLICVISLV